MRIQRGILAIFTDPATEPVTRDEVKAHARIEVTADDTLIDTYITAARQMVEQYTGRALITQTWRLTLDNWPGASRDDWWDGCREGALTMVDAADTVQIRKAPFIAVTAVETLAESDGTPTAWASSNWYSTVEVGGFGRLVKKSSQVWPLITAGNVRLVGGIVITFTAGYGALASNVPMAIRQALKMICASWYENRDEAGKAIPAAALALLQQYVVVR